MEAGVGGVELSQVQEVGARSPRSEPARLECQCRRQTRTSRTVYVRALVVLLLAPGWAGLPQEPQASKALGTLTL